MTLSGIFKVLIRRAIKLSTKMLKTGPPLTRYYMYQHIVSVFNSLKKDNRYNHILSISRSRKLCNLLGIEEPKITDADFPKYNILKLPFPDNSFDYVVSDQILEHVEGNPQQAFDETYRVLKPSGIAIHTTCFINPIHNKPKDLWRFTPSALALLSNKFSKIIDVGGWGNSYVWFAIWLGLKSCPVPHARWHPLHKIAIKNDEKCPLMTWIIAQK